MLWKPEVPTRSTCVCWEFRRNTENIRGWEYQTHSFLSKCFMTISWREGCKWLFLGDLVWYSYPKISSDVNSRKKKNSIRGRTCMETWLETLIGASLSHFATCMVSHEVAISIYNTSEVMMDILEISLGKMGTNNLGAWLDFPDFT